MVRNVIIDRGHDETIGTDDPGVCRDWFGRTEGEFNALMARMAWEDLRRIDGIEVYDIARYSRPGLSLPDRGEVSKQIGGGLLLSIHTNASRDPSHGGAMGFSLNGDYVGSQVAKEAARCAPGPLYKRKNRFFTTSPNDWTRRAHNVLSPHKGHCVPVLFELGYMSNRENAAAMELYRIQQGLVCAIRQSVLHWLYLKKEGAPNCR